MKTAIIYLLLTASAHATEAEISDPWCRSMGGMAQARLVDGTEADCLTDHHAIEADYANKWYEAVGQSLHYATVTGKLPGILIILRKPGDERHVRRLYAVIRAYSLPITVWEVER